MFQDEAEVVSIFTDGACSGNPGPGGWAAVLKYKGHRKEISGGERRTTNNRMELLAIIEGLESLKRPCTVVVYTDSRYISDAINKGWLTGWKRRGWKRAGNKPLKNMELWKRLASLIRRHKVKFVWIKGHSGHEENERCDTLAKQEINRIRERENSDAQ